MRACKNPNIIMHEFHTLRRFRSSVSMLTDNDLTKQHQSVGSEENAMLSSAHCLP